LKIDRLTKSAANVNCSSKIMSPDSAAAILDVFAKKPYVFVAVSKKLGSTIEMVGQ
jgi:hypothetical protein